MNNEKKELNVEELANKALEIVTHIELLAETTIGAIITYLDFKQSVAEKLTQEDKKMIEEKIREGLNGKTALGDLHELLNTIMA